MWELCIEDINNTLHSPHTQNTSQPSVQLFPGPSQMSHSQPFLPGSVAEKHWSRRVVFLSDKKPSGKFHLRCILFLCVLLGVSTVKLIKLNVFLPLYALYLLLGALRSCAWWQMMTWIWPLHWCSDFWLLRCTRTGIGRLNLQKKVHSVFLSRACFFRFVLQRGSPKFWLWPSENYHFCWWGIENPFYVKTSTECS